MENGESLLNNSILHENNEATVQLAKQMEDELNKVARAHALHLALEESGPTSGIDLEGDIAVARKLRTLIDTIRSNPSLKLTKIENTTPNSEKLYSVTAVENS